jgi:Icc-related predicted phosphoesterase
MVRVRVLSDLHLEFGPFQVPQAACDVTVLAGDTYTKGRAWPIDDVPSLFNSPVIAVAGNHEFYGTSVDAGMAKLQADSAARGIELLENREVFVSGIRFLGCTLWSDFRLFAEDDLATVRQHANYCVGSRQGGGMNDFRLIRVAADGYRRFRPLDAARRFEQSVAWLRASLSVHYSGATVVITHHAPSHLCYGDDKRLDLMNCAYASNLDSFIEEMQPDVWISGHIHESVPGFTIGRTRIVSNPRGYEPDAINPAFDPTLVIDV